MIELASELDPQVRIAKLERDLAMYRVIEAKMIHEHREIERVLGKALYHGTPWDLTTVQLAVEAGNRIACLERAIDSCLYVAE